MKKIIQTDNAPAAIGTYSQAVQVNGLVFISGQIPLIPETMRLIKGAMDEQIHQVFKNLKAIARAAGGDLCDIVKLNVFLTDMDDFPMVNEVMAIYFDEPYPARAAVAVSQLPKGVPVEMEAVMALLDKD